MRALLDLREQRIEAGERPIGWKLGFGAPAALESLGIDRPLIGFLTDRSLLPDGATCSLAGWMQPVLETEIAIHVGADGGIAALGPAIELADIDPQSTDPEQILAGNIYHRHVVFGPANAGVRSAAGIYARVRKNGDEVAATDDPEALTGKLPALMRHVADALAAHGEQLHAGDVVIAGSVVPPLPVAPRDEVVAELVPLGSLRMRFS